MTKGDILFEIVTKEQLLHWLEGKWNLSDELAAQVNALEAFSDQVVEENKLLVEKHVGQDPDTILTERTLLASEGIPEETGEEGAA